jgi:hypothetical protein
MNMDAGGLHEFHDWNQMAEETMQPSRMRIAPFQVTEFNQVAGLAELTDPGNLEAELQSRARGQLER